MNFDLRALIFDMDGVIADTLELHHRAWQQLAREEGIPFTAEQYRQMQGLARRQSLDIFLNGFPLTEEQAQLWMARKNGYFLDLLNSFTPDDCKPGAQDLIREAHQAGLKIGLGSSSQNARRVIDLLQLTSAFEVIADGNTVHRNKPAPDIFLWVAGQLGVQPAQAVVFEDSEAGLQAALAGGFYTVGVGNEHGGGAHWVVQSLAEVTLDGLRERMAISF